MRPTFVAPDAGGLLAVHHAPNLSDGVAWCGDWTAQRDAGGGLRLTHTTDTGLPTSDDDLDPLRALCVLAWSLADGAGTGHAGDWPVRGADDPAAAAVHRLGLGQ